MELPASVLEKNRRFSCNEPKLADTAAPRVNILGVAISAICLDEATRMISKWIESGDRNYVNVCTVHTIMECQKNLELKRIVNRSGLSTPDGMPLVWLCHY